MKTYRLFRQYGLIAFNSFEAGERYWISYQAAAQGGGDMYDEIDEGLFNDVFEQRTSIKDVYHGLRPRAYIRQNETVIDEKYKLEHAISLHELISHKADPVVSTIEI